MSSFYELNEDEVKMIIAALEFYRKEGKLFKKREILQYLALCHYLETREVRCYD